MNQGVKERRYKPGTKTGLEEPGYTKAISAERPNPCQLGKTEFIARASLHRHVTGLLITAHEQGKDFVV